MGIVAARRRRHHVPDAAAERRRRASTRSTGRIFWIYQAPRSRRTSRSAAARTTAAWRSSATRCSWARSTRTWSRSMRATGALIWNDEGRRVRARLLREPRAARGEGQGDRRRRRRRVRHPRLHRRVRRRRPARRSGASTPFPRPGEPGSETWSGDAWKTGGGSIWVTGSYDPDAQPDLLGHRQSRARTSIRRSGRATTSTPTRSSRSTPTPAS